MNLWDELMGEGGVPEQAPSGSAIRCACGRRVGVETAELVWLAGYDHAPAGAADVLFSAALEDFELAAELEDVEAVTVIPEFCRLANGGDGDLSRLAVVLPRLRVPPRVIGRDEVQVEPGRDLHRAGGPWAPMGCTACRTIYDARQVLSLGRRNKRGDLLAERSVTITDTMYAVPRDGLGRRVEMYRRLSAVLSSQHSAS